MAASRHTKSGPELTPAAPARWKWLWLALLLVAVGAAAFFVLQNKPPVVVPQISTTGFDPVVTRQIEAALATVRAAPRSARHWGELAMVLHVYEFPAESSACYATAARLDAREPRWPYLRALLLLPREPETALADLQRATSLAGSRTDAPRLRLAETLAERGRAEEAAAQFNELLRARPDHAAAQLGLARLHLAAGRAAEARPLLERCARDPHTTRTAHSLLAGAARALGDPAAAESAARRARALPADRGWPDPYRDELAARRLDATGLLNRARQFLDAGDARAALPLIEQVLGAHPEMAEGWLLRSRARMAGRDCPGAEKALREHVRLAPGAVNGHFHLGVALLCQERYAESIGPFERATQLKPDYGEAHYNLGFALARAGRSREAIPRFREAIRVSPEFMDAYITLADLLQQTGARDEALEIVRRALALDPSDERAKTLRARLGGP